MPSIGTVYPSPLGYNATARHVILPSINGTRSSTGISMRIERFLRLVVDWRMGLLVVGIVLTVVSQRVATRLEFDRSIENLFAPDDPILPPYRRFKDIFGADDLALAAYSDPRLLTAEGLTRLDQLSSQLAETPGVESVFSLTHGLGAARLLLSTPLGEPILELCEGYTISADRRTAGIVCMLKREQVSGVDRAVTVDALRQTIERFDASGVLTGEPVMIVDGFRYLEADGELLGCTATALLVLVIAVCFRSVRWVIVPLAVVYAALVWTQAILVVSGLRLSMVSSMLWSIVAVIGISMTVHVIIGFRERRALGEAPREAFLSAAIALAVPIFWACATDAAGFGALVSANVGPVRDFGKMMALASMLVLVALVVLAPGLALLGRWDIDPKRVWGESRIERELRRMVRWIDRRPTMIAVATIVIVSFTGAGIMWLEVETDFTKNFRAGSTIVRAYDFVETRLGGAGVWDIMVPIDESNGGEFLERVRRLEERLRTEAIVHDANGQPVGGLTKVLSLVDVLDRVLPFAARGGGGLSATLPVLTKAAPIAAAFHGVEPRDVGDEREHREYLRIMLRARERQPAAEKEQLIAQVTRIAREEFPEAEVTGVFVLLARLVAGMSGDQWITFFIATAAIGAMMVLAFRDIPLALVALVPNMLPIYIVTGLTGWLGVRVNMGTAMIAAVSMGLGIDVSVHYIISYKRLRTSGKSIYDALDGTHQQVGPATLFSTLALVVGFSSLVLSEFVPTIYFGTLVSLTMLGGLVGNLVVLPLLLRLVDRDTPVAEPRIQHGQHS